MTDKKMEITDKMVEGVLVNEEYISFIHSLMHSASTLHFMVQEITHCAREVVAMTDEALRERLGGDKNPYLKGEGEAVTMNSYRVAAAAIIKLDADLMQNIVNIQTTGCSCGKPHSKKELDEMRDAIREMYESNAAMRGSLH